MSRILHYRTEDGKEGTIELINAVELMNMSDAELDRREKARESEIPDDVMLAAMAAVGERNGDMVKAPAHLIRPVADAIMAERERCAKIAASFGSVSGELIEALIRKGSPP